MKNFAVVFLGVLVMIALAIVLRVNDSSSRNVVDSKASGVVDEANSTPPPGAKPHYFPNGQMEKWADFSGKTLPRSWNDLKTANGVQIQKVKGFQSEFSLKAFFPKCPQNQNGEYVCDPPRELELISRPFNLTKMGIVADKKLYLAFDYNLSYYNAMSTAVTMRKCEYGICSTFCVAFSPQFIVNKWTSRIQKCAGVDQYDLSADYYVDIFTANNLRADKADVNFRMDNLRLIQ